MSDESAELKINGNARKDDDKKLLLLLLLTIGDTYDAEQLWQQNAPTAFKAMLGGKGFQYDEAIMQWSSALQPIASAKVKQAVIAASTAIESRVASATESLVSGRIELPDWQQQMVQYIKGSQIAASAIARGGMERLSGDELSASEDCVPETPAEVFSTGDQVLYQVKRLQLFAKQIESRDPAADTAQKIINRAKLYPRQSITFYESARQREAKAVGVLQEQNILGDAEHCEECLYWTNQGWQAVGTIPAPGRRICRMNCHCQIGYRMSDGRVLP